MFCFSLSWSIRILTFTFLKSLVSLKNKMVLRAFSWSLHTISFVQFMEKLSYRVWKATLNKLLRLETSPGSSSRLKCRGIWYMHSCMLALGIRTQIPMSIQQALSDTESSPQLWYLLCLFFLIVNRFVSHTLRPEHSFSSLHSSQFPLILHSNKYPLPLPFPSENNKPPRDINETAQNKTQ